MAHENGQSASQQISKLSCHAAAYALLAFVSDRQEGRKIPKIFCNQGMVQGVSEFLNKMLGNAVAGAGLTYVYS